MCMPPVAARAVERQGRVPAPEDPAAASWPKSMSTQPATAVVWLRLRAVSVPSAFSCRRVWPKEDERDVQASQAVGAALAQAAAIAVLAGLCGASLPLGAAAAYCIA